MEGISKKRLEEIAEDYPPDHRNHRMAKYLIATECQEHWMTLDEFLKSGFVGKCWVYSEDIVLETEYDTNGFWYVFKYIDDNKITHVMPIHKPEPPK